jgi:hypothetical protein
MIAQARRALVLIVVALILFPVPARGQLNAYSIANCFGKNQSLSGRGYGESMWNPAWFQVSSFHYTVDSRGVLTFRHAYSSGGHYGNNVVAGDTGDGSWWGSSWRVSGAHYVFNGIYWAHYKNTWTASCGIVNFLDLATWWPAPQTERFWCGSSTC